MTTNCKLCNVEFTGRADKKFCSDKCRNNYNNRQDYQLKLFKLTQKRALKQNIAFNITIDDLVFPDVCPIFGIPLNRGIGKRSDNSYSLDRIIPELGYVKGNVWIISDRANRLKSDMSKDELLRFCRVLLSKIE